MVALDADADADAGADDARMNGGIDSCDLSNMDAWMKERVDYGDRSLHECDRQ